jgi:hypothetical protein
MAESQDWSTPAIDPVPRKRRRDHHGVRRIGAGLLVLATAMVGAGVLQGESASRTPSVSPLSGRTEAIATPTPVREVFAGGSIESAVAAQTGGGTIVVHAGSYPRVALSRTFSKAVHIVGAPGEDVSVGGFVISGAGYAIGRLRTDGESRLEGAAHDVTFDRVVCHIPSADTADSCFAFHDASHDAVISRSVARGGLDGVKFYGCGGAPWANNISVIDSEITGAQEDLIHVDCADDVTIEHNDLHDPAANSDHNDGIQSQASNNLRIIGNTFSFSTVPAVGGPNQAMMLGNVPAQWPGRKVTNTVVAYNVVRHWNGGRALIMNGTENLRIVNNTFVDSGNAAINDPSITVGNQGAYGGQNPGLEIWNNIMQSVYYDPGSRPPAFFSTNLLTQPRPGMSGTNVITGPQNYRYALATGSPSLAAATTHAGISAAEPSGRRR